MKNYRIVSLFILMIFFTQLKANKDTLIINLIEDANTEIIMDIDDGDYDILIKNLLLSKEYSIRINEKIVEMPSLDVENLIKTQKKTSSNDSIIIKNIFDSIIKITNEGVQANYLKVVRLKYSDNTTVSAYIDKFQKLTTKKISRKIRKSSETEIVITRNGRKWKYKLKSKSAGKWSTSYGFSFVPNYLSKNDLFYTKQVDSSQIKIIKRAEGDWMTYIPTAFVHWSPFENKYDIDCSITGGLGLDFSNPEVFLGAAFTYKKNLTLSLGLTAFKQKRLDTRFKENEIVNQLISDEDLHKKYWRSDVFFALAFRFNSSPFKAQ